MKKYLKALCLTIATTMVFASCAKPAEKQTPPADQKATASATSSEQAKESTDAKKSDLKVALLLPGPINDGGWCASAYAGLEKIKAEFNCETAFTESIPASNYEEIYRNFAQAGFNVIIGHGFEFGDAAKKVAKDFPDIKFFVSSTDISQEPNLASFKNDYFECGYLQGVVAAYMSKSGIIGAVGGMDIPPISEPLRAYEAGAKAVKPDIKVLRVMTGSFDDLAKAKDTALSMIEQGADIIMLDADHAGLGVIEACKEKKVFAIGSIADQRDLAPDVILCSGIADISEAFLQMTKMIDDGSFKPQYYKMGVSKNVVKLSDFGPFDSQVPQEAKDKLKELEDGFRADTLNAQALTEDYFKTVK